MLILPVWLWLVLAGIALIVAVVGWAKKTLVDGPRSARAVAAGVAISDARLESGCRRAILEHELTMPDPTAFVGFLQPLEYTDTSKRVLTPISLGLSERTLCVTYRTGSLGNTVNVLVDHRDITTGQSTTMRGKLAYSIETAKARRFTFRLSSQRDFTLLESWAQVNPKESR